MNDKRIDVVVGVLVHEGCVLICRRRKQDTFADLWEFPGGKREVGESPEQCLARELVEELGVSPRISASLDAIDYDYPNLCVRLLPFLCDHAGEEVRPLASQEVRWVQPRELRDHPFPAANATLIEQIIRRLG